MNRRYPEGPMTGVGAVIFRQDRVLLVQRGREPAYGRWSLPGGLVELGETLEEAVKREVLEESGLNVEVRDLVAALDRVILDDKGRIEYHYILLDFLCECPQGEPVPASDALDCVFTPIEDLARFDLTEGAADVIVQAFSLRREGRLPVYRAGR